MKVIYQDTREKRDAVKAIDQALNERGYKLVRTKLYVGDYQLLSNPYFVIDRKQNLSELCNNLCSKDHRRIIAEFKRANDLGVRICILCEHGGKVESIEDVKDWYNPRLKTNPRATKGETLYKTMNTVAWKYNVTFEFCRKSETGRRIIELLEEANDHGEQ